MCHINVPHSGDTGSPPWTRTGLALVREDDRTRLQPPIRGRRARPRHSKCLPGVIFPDSRMHRRTPPCCGYSSRAHGSDCYRLRTARRRPTPRPIRAPTQANPVVSQDSSNTTSPAPSTRPTSRPCEQVSVSPTEGPARDDGRTPDAFQLVRVSTDRTAPRVWRVRDRAPPKRPRFLARMSSGDARPAIPAAGSVCLASGPMTRSCRRASDRAPLVRDRAAGMRSDRSSRARADVRAAEPPPRTFLPCERHAADRSRGRFCRVFEGPDNHINASAPTRARAERSTERDRMFASSRDFTPSFIAHVIEFQGVAVARDAPLFPGVLQPALETFHIMVTLRIGGILSEQVEERNVDDLASTNFHVFADPGGKCVRGMVHHDLGLPGVIPEFFLDDLSDRLNLFS